MEACEFKIKNGLIQIPEKYTQKIGNNVKVIILSDPKDRQNDIIDELLNNPVEINNFIPPPFEILQAESPKCSYDYLARTYSICRPAEPFKAEPSCRPDPPGKSPMMNRQDL